MNKQEPEYDKKLNISTCGREAHMEDDIHHAYEPTPYCVLERLLEEEYITSENKLVDYGCGKGRVAFFFNSRTGCRAVGLDFDEKMIADAKKNLETFHGRDKSGVEFVCEDASTFDPKDADTFFFFNPFDELILKRVIRNIVESSYENEAQSLLFFYYPSDEYVSTLMTTPELDFVDEIDVSDLFCGQNTRERILIFSVG